LPAIGTKHPLATDELAAGVGRIIAAKNTVPVQGFIAPAAWTALLLEGKSSVFNFGASATKRKGRDMGELLSKTKRLVEIIFYGTADGATRFRKVKEKRRTALNGTLAALRS
jgi:hypothetical protein